MSSSITAATRRRRQMKGKYAVMFEEEYRKAAAKTEVPHAVQ